MKGEEGWFDDRRRWALMTGAGRCRVNAPGLCTAPGGEKRSEKWLTWSGDGCCRVKSVTPGLCVAVSGGGGAERLPSGGGARWAGWRREDRRAATAPCGAVAEGLR